MVSLHRNTKLRIMALILMLIMLVPQVIFAESYNASPNKNPAPSSSSRPDKREDDMLVATTAIAVDATTGRQLYGKQEDRKIYPASTTKVLTALLVLENLDLDQEVEVSRNAIVGESSIYLEEGEVITIRDLLHGLLLKSGNDAAVALAEAVAGSVKEFAVMMNERAAELGCVNSNFKNPHGLPNEEHYTTAQDYARIVIEASKHEEFMNIVSTLKYTIHSKRADGSDRDYTISNTNKLLPNSGEEFAYEYMLGGKTGYTDAAQNAFVGVSEKDGMRVVTVVFGSTQEQKWWDTQKLANYAFSVYNPLPAQDIYAANTITVNVENAQNPDDATLTLRLPEEEAARLSFLCSPEEIEDIRLNFSQYASITYRDGAAVTAPVQQGETVATLYFNYPNVPEITLNLTADRMIASVIEETPAAQETQLPVASSGISIVTHDVAQDGWSALYLLVIIPIVLFVILLVWLIVEIKRAKIAKREEERRRRTEEINRKRALREQAHLQSSPLPRSQRGGSAPYSDAPRPANRGSARSHPTNRRSR